MGMAIDNLLSILACFYLVCYVIVVVASSPHSATGILKTQDRLLSAWSPPDVVPYEFSLIDQHSIVFSSDLSNHWKFLREFCRTHLFSPKAVESQIALREKKVSDTILSQQLNGQ
ncbi:hypothetical protein MTR67_013815 [Solanum verrucosum]|uniref:Uncharacterized protein n=1 Tax=Solanum verrucosum TaxID=315347 RepID=A0AAF0QFQ4_SOLVR|nr:hypothetical protein MTR67_013815 [Solanum verrucosum]